MRPLRDKDLLLILLFYPLSIQASCIDNDDPAYNLAVSQGNYAKAFDLLAQELHLRRDEASHFKIVQGFSASHDDRHGEADPDTLELSLDPGLFMEGKEGACQGVAHELTHLRQFQRDRRFLHNTFSKQPVPEKGWNGCDRDHLDKPDAAKAEDDAYECLEDNDVAPHAAAEDIEAVLAQIPYAAQHLLRNDDVSYLAENVKNWADHEAMITDHSNESYYLPEIKSEDIRIFCRGFKETRALLVNTGPALGAWQFFCRGRH